VALTVVDGDEHLQAGAGNPGDHRLDDAVAQLAPQDDAPVGQAAHRTAAGDDGVAGQAQVGEERSRGEPAPGGDDDDGDASLGAGGQGGARPRGDGAIPADEGPVEVDGDESDGQRPASTSPPRDEWVSRRRRAECAAPWA
jgi:hypothetical protein